MVPELSGDSDTQYFDVIEDEKEKPESFVPPRVSRSVLMLSVALHWPCVYVQVVHVIHAQLESGSLIWTSCLPCKKDVVGIYDLIVQPSV